MNDQIRELCIKSGAYEHYEVNEGVNGDDLPMQKFAELIVQECIEIIRPTEHHEAWAQGYLGGVDGLELLEIKIKALKLKFGVK